MPVNEKKKDDTHLLCYLGSNGRRTEDCDDRLRKTGKCEKVRVARLVPGRSARQRLARAEPRGDQARPVMGSTLREHGMWWEAGGPAEEVEEGGAEAPWDVWAGAYDAMEGSNEGERRAVRGQ